ncbi:MAG TPA: hypothetical protein VII58_02190 [Acidobacteriaceae bacterium]
MTVNERLFEAGLINAWDEAARSRNRGEMIELLRRVELSDDAEKIADAILIDPKKYGF